MAIINTIEVFDAHKAFTAPINTMFSVMAEFPNQLTNSYLIYNTPSD